MHSNNLKWLLVGLTFIFWLDGFSQNIVPKGEFLQQNVKIGEEISYSFSVRYPRSINLVFPDSTYDYSPFELDRRVYFKTRSDSATSYDSAVYYLATFEIDSVQHLQLPLFVITDMDCTAIYSRPDSIYLTEVVEKIPEAIEMISDADFVKVRKAFNYPYFLVALGLLFVVGLFILIVFGKKIGKAWLMYRMRKAHKSFTQRFFNLMRDVSSNNPSRSPEQVLSAWKKYMEKLEKAPFTKWTTKEIVQHYSENDLKDNLKAIDRSIYGAQSIKNLFNAFDFLLKFSTNRYHSKMEEVKNG